MSNEHLMFKEEATWGTYVAPTLAIPVRSAAVNAETTQLEAGVTGGGRGRRVAAHGGITATGPIETLLYPLDVWKLIRTCMRQRTSSQGAPTWQPLTVYALGAVVRPIGAATANNFRVTTAGTSGASEPTWVTTPAGTTTDASVTWTQQAATLSGFRSNFLPDDELPLQSLSLQKRYSLLRSESIRGAKINTLTVNAASGEYVTFTADMLAKDAAGRDEFGVGTWSDGTAAPATIDPVPYTTPFPDAFKFYEAEFILGGTVVNTGGELIVTGGAPRAEVDNVAIEANFNLADDAFGLVLNDYTLQSMDEGIREITITFEPNFATVGFEYYKAWRAGTPAVVVLHCQGPRFNAAPAAPVYYDAKFVFPYVVYSAAAAPELNAEYGLKRTEVAGDCFVDESLGVDWGITVTAPVDLTLAMP